VVALGFVIWALRWKEWSYAVYMGLLLTSLVTSTYYLSIPRLLLSMFPIPLFLAAATRDRPDASRFVLVAFGVLALVGVATFTYGMGFY
jgi:hypothetical protein